MAQIGLSRRRGGVGMVEVEDWDDDGDCWWLASGGRFG
jgi:hypothetical protein